MNFGERWFPASDGGNVVGRFSEAPKVDVKASEAAQKNVYVNVPILLSKFPGSVDVACQQVKPMNERDLVARFPDAWAYYQASKAAPPMENDIPAVTSGTPLHLAEFIPRDKIAWLQTIGFSTVEQLAEMSDATVQNLSRGALGWRKKAQEFAKRT